MRILGVSVLGLIELSACWREREWARHTMDYKTRAAFEDSPWVRHSAPARLAQEGEYNTLASERHRECG